MSRLAVRRRRAWWVVVLAVSLSLAGALPASGADADAEGRFVRLVNHERAQRGLPALTVASDLATAARQHSARMAAEGRMWHNERLGSQVGGYRRLGENVGYGGSVPDVHRALMASATHRANILSTSFTQLGVGVEWRDDTLWVTQVFREPTGAEWTAAPQPHATVPTRPPLRHQHTHPARRDDPGALVSTHLRLVFARVESVDSGTQVSALVSAIGTGRRSAVGIRLEQLERIVR